MNKLSELLKALSKENRLQYNNERINSRFVFALCFSFSFSLVLIFILKSVAPIKFATNDDYALNLLLSGAFGQLSGYDMFQNIVLGKALSFFYLIIPSINWYGVFMLGIFYLSFSVFGALLIDRFGLPIGIPLLILSTTLFETTLLYMFQWTICSYACIFVGLALLVHGNSSTNAKRKLCFILSVFFLCISFMIRWHVIIPVAAMLGGYCIIILFTQKKMAIPTVVTVGIFGVIYFLLNTVNTIAYNSDPQWKEFLELNTARSALNDFSCPDYGTHKDLYDSIGWSENDRTMFTSFVTPDEEKFSTANLEKLVNARNQDQYNLNPKSLLHELKNEIESSSNIQVALWVMFFAFLVAFFFNKNKILPVCLALSAPLFNIAFLVVGRAVDRVVYPQYIIAALLLLYIIDFDEIKMQLNINFETISAQTKAKLMALLLIISLTVSGVYMHSKLNEYKNLYSGSDPSIGLFDKYVSENQQNVYVIAPNCVAPRNLYYSILRSPEKDSLANAFPIGGWEQRTKDYYGFKTRNSIDNIFKDLLTKDNYYIAPLSYENIFITYFYENYGVHVKMQTVHESGNIKICKVVIIK